MRRGTLNKGILKTGLFVFVLSTLIIAQPDTSLQLIQANDDSDLVKILKSDASNPFGEEDQIRFQLNDTVFVTVTIVTPQGETIRELLSAELDPGIHTLSWDRKDDAGKQAESGVFMYEVNARHIKRSATLALLN